MNPSPEAHMLLFHRQCQVNFHQLWLGFGTAHRVFTASIVHPLCGGSYNSTTTTTYCVTTIIITLVMGSTKILNEETAVSHKC